MNVFTDSMENYDTKAKLITKWNGPTFNSAIAVGAGFAISAAAQGISLTGAGISRFIPAAAHYFGGIRYKMVSGFTSNAGAIFNCGDGSGIFHIQVGWLNASGFLTATRAGSFGGGGSTLVATSSLTVVAGSVHFYEWEIVVDSTVGVFKLWVDGTLYINFSGNTAGTSVHSVANVGYYAGSNGAVAYLNDAYINDSTGSINNTLEGDVTIRSYPVASAGSHADFTRGGIDTGTNAGQLAKLYADAASINQDFVVGHRDSFVVGAVPSGTLHGVKLWCYAQKDNIGTRSMALTEESGATDDIGTTQSLSGPGYGWYQREAFIDVHTGVVWASLAALNAAKWGYKVIA